MHIKFQIYYTYINIYTMCVYNELNTTDDKGLKFINPDENVRFSV